MKKVFLLTALAAGILSSCSEDDFGTQSVVDNNTIAFATNKAKSMTRSAETITSINKFTVSAVNNDNSSFFSNEEFTYNSGSGVFKSQTPHYWPTTGTLSFYAISNIGAYSTDANNAPKYTYSNWEAEKDLVSATVKAGEKETPYPLTFRHVTSQIYVSAEAENKDDELTYNLISVKMTTPSTGTYSFANTTGGMGTWEIDNTKTSQYSFGEALPMSFKQNGQIELSSCYWNILPVSDGNIYFRIEYQVLQNGKVICDYTGDKYKECTVEKPGLVSGKKYRYNFKLTRNVSSEITFVASMTDWEDGSSTTYKPIIHVDANGAEYVDLDLPSGMLWATCNIGATKPEEYGNYYMWGATTALTNVENGVDWTTHPYSVAGSQKEMTKYNDTDNLVTLEPMDDAAHVNMGGDWRMPTKDEVSELCTNTTQTNTTLNGVQGILFTSKKDPNKTLFFPAAGYVTTSKLTSETVCVDVWTSTRHTGITNGMIFGASQATIEVYKARSAYRIWSVTNYNFDGANARGFAFNYEGRTVRGVISTEK